MGDVIIGCVLKIRNMGGRGSNAAYETGFGYFNV
jgi:hypothetical protein